MMKLLLLAVIVLAKVLITKGVALVCIILSFIFKGKQLHKSAFEWDNYFLSLNDDLCNCLPLNMNDNIIHTNATPLVIKTFVSKITASSNNFIIKIPLLVSYK